MEKHQTLLLKYEFLNLSFHSKVVFPKKYMIKGREYNPEEDDGENDSDEEDEDNGDGDSGDERETRTKMKKSKS